MAITLLDKLLAMSKEILTARIFGISPDLDVFNLSFAIPGIVSALFCEALHSALVPLYMDWRKTSAPQSTVENVQSAFLASFGLLLMATGACYILSPWMFPLVGFGMSEEMQRLGITMEQALAFLVVLEGVSALFSGLLRCLNRYAAITFAQTFINVFLITMLLTLGKLGIWVLVVGTLTGAAAKLLFLVSVTSREKFGLSRSLSFRRDETAQFFRLAFPLLGGALIVNANLMVDQSMATMLAPGGVSALRYAFRLNDLPLQLLFVALAQAIFPFISDQAARNDLDAIRHIFKRSLLFIALIALPATFYMEFHARDIVVALLKRGAFGESAVELTTRTLRCYSAGLFFLAYAFTNGVFFTALKRARALLVMGIFSFILNAVLNLAFIRLFGQVYGIALSSTVMTALTVIVLFIILRRQLDIRFSRSYCVSLALPIFASTAATILCLVLSPAIDTLDVWPRLLLSSSVFSVTYAITIGYLRTREIEETLALNRVLNRLRCGWGEIRKGATPK